MDDTPKEKRTRKRTPSARQVKTLQLINQGYSISKAMREAGYARGYAKTPTLFMRQPNIKKILLGMKDELVSAGLTQRFMAAKLQKWINAQKEDPDDYEVQLKAYDRWKNMMDYNGEAKLNGVKRRMTIEEFVMGGEEHGAEEARP